MGNILSFLWVRSTWWRVRAGVRGGKTKHPLSNINCIRSRASQNFNPKIVRQCLTDCCIYYMLNNFRLGGGTNAATSPQSNGKYNFFETASRYFTLTELLLTVLLCIPLVQLLIKPGASFLFEIKTVKERQHFSLKGILYSQLRSCRTKLRQPVIPL